MATIDVVFQHSGLLSGRERLSVYTREILGPCLTAHRLKDVEMTVLFCSRSAIRRLKHEFLGENMETDVLSFPAWTDRRVLRRREPFYLGDLAVCLPVCAQQAREEKRPLAEELALLLVHGMLHLTGYDHDSELKRRVMWQETDRLLALTSDVRRPRIQLRPGAIR